MKTVKEEGVSLVEAKVEASKLSKGGKTYSIMEEDGDFFVREGHNPDAYQLYINGAKAALETPMKAPDVKTKQSTPEQAIKALKKAKDSKPPILSSLPAKVHKAKEEKSRAAKLKAEIEEERAEVKARAAAKQKAKPKVAIISSDEDEEEVVVSKSKKSEIKNSNKMKTQNSTTVKKSMPLAWIVELIQEKKNVAKDLIRKKLEKDYALGTVNTQMARLKNHPNLVVAEDVVKYIK